MCNEILGLVAFGYDKVMNMFKVSTRTWQLLTLAVINMNVSFVPLKTDRRAISRRFSDISCTIMVGYLGVYFLGQFHKTLWIGHHGDQLSLGVTYMNRFEVAMYGFMTISMPWMDDYFEFYAMT